jgi:hypothetical protein
MALRPGAVDQTLWDRGRIRAYALALARPGPPPRETRSCRVQRISIVRPEDVSVIDPDSRSLLTLVTCYPFYFVGPAPERFIVRSELVH